MRDTLAAVSHIHPTVIVSGRGREDVSELVALDNIYYAGSHGFDIAGPAGSTVRHEIGREYRSALEQTVQTLRQQLSHVGGVLIEDKQFSVAVHYRRVADGDVPQIEDAIDRLVAANAQLAKTLGKKVFEVRPSIEWDKGKAILWIIDALELDTADVVPLYIGDDVTDEDAFAVLRDRGLGILVADEPRNTHATMHLKTTDEVGQFLRLLSELRTRGAS
jgi:alpha,alpha-trehalase